MEAFNPYIAVIYLSVLIVISYLFNLVSSKVGIPSVLLLIGLGIGLSFAGDAIGLPRDKVLFDALEVLGIIGLIMIVLEAALDLELNRSKWPLISKALLVALVALIVGSLLIALILQYFIIENFTIALLYAIPLSVISSAIIIPSVGDMTEEKKEFLIYESTFSDILGIMYFYFLVGNIDNNDVSSVVWEVVSNIVITIIISIIASYLLVLIFQKLKTQVKLFLLVAVLTILYSLGKLMHLSSLLIILVFGLVLNNYHVFFRGKLKKWIDVRAVHGILSNFHLVTIETAFVVRTLFFVLFGLTIEVSALKEINTLIISFIIVAIIFILRALVMKLVVKKNIYPQVLMAPRGLITILLFFAIPVSLHVDAFSSAILLYTILITSAVMAVALIASGKHIEPVDAAQLAYWHELDKQIEEIPEDEKHLTAEEKEKRDEDTTDPDSA